MSISGSPLRAQTPGFWDPGFTAGKIQSDYNPGSNIGTSLNPLQYSFPGPGSEGCLYNASLSFMRCPGRNGDPTGLPAGGIGAQVRPFCGGSSVVEGLTWRGCRRFSQGNAWSTNSPTSQYWVIHANVEPAFDQCNSGPPGQS